MELDVIFIWMTYFRMKTEDRIHVTYAMPCDRGSIRSFITTRRLQNEKIKRNLKYDYFVTIQLTDNSLGGYRGVCGQNMYNTGSFLKRSGLRVLVH